jgi:hypothetical protein
MQASFRPDSAAIRVEPEHREKPLSAWGGVLFSALILNTFIPALQKKTPLARGKRGDPW